MKFAPALVVETPGHAIDTKNLKQHESKFRDSWSDRYLGEVLPLWEFVGCKGVHAHPADKLSKTNFHPLKILLFAR
jgi:hypothetical protein